MKLTELFDQSYKFTLVPGGDGVWTTFKNGAGDKITVAFSDYPIPKVGTAYEIAFIGSSAGADLSGRGDEFKTFSTILAIVEKFMEQTKGSAPLFFFTAKTKSRMSLYTRLSKMMLKAFTDFEMVKPDDLNDETREWWDDLGLGDEAVIIARRTLLEEDFEDVVFEGPRDLELVKRDYAKWKKMMNMSTKNLRYFVETEEGRNAGLSAKEVRKGGGLRTARSSARALLKMRARGIGEWTSGEINWMYRQMAYVKRMRELDGPLFTTTTKGKRVPTKKLATLWVWGHYPPGMTPGRFGVKTKD